MKLPALLTCASALCGLIACGSQPVPPRAPVDQVASERSASSQRSDQATSSRSSSDDEVAVRASLESSVMGLNPGQRFLLASRFKIPEGYRVSWVNPGDMGHEPVIEFKVPESFEVGPLMFPGPKRFTLPNGAVSYAYDNETAVFVEVRAPQDLKPSQFYRFELQATWFSCKKKCLKESVDAYFELEATDYPVESTLDAPMQSALKAIPKPLEELSEAKTEWQDNGVLLVHAAGVTWKDFFPSSPE